MLVHRDLEAKRCEIDMIDWNQIWKDALLASRLTGDNYYDQRVGDSRSSLRVAHDRNDL